MTQEETAVWYAYPAEPRASMDATKIMSRTFKRIVAVRFSVKTKNLPFTSVAKILGSGK